MANTQLHNATTKAAVNAVRYGPGATGVKAGCECRIQRQIAEVPIAIARWPQQRRVISVSAASRTRCTHQPNTNALAKPTNEVSSGRSDRSGAGRPCQYTRSDSDTRHAASGTPRITFAP